MGVDGFKCAYLAGFGLLVAGVLTLAVSEAVAAWANKQPGDTITELVRGLDLPGFVFVTAAAVSVALAAFGVSLALHLWGKLGL